MGDRFCPTRILLPRRISCCGRNVTLCSPVPPLGPCRLLLSAMAPLAVLRPTKFAVIFTLGNLLSIGRWGLRCALLFCAGSPPPHTQQPTLPTIHTKNKKNQQPPHPPPPTHPQHHVPHGSLEAASKYAQHNPHHTHRHLLGVHGPHAGCSPRVPFHTALHTVHHHAVCSAHMVSQLGFERSAHFPHVHLCVELPSCAPVR
jgi:hypothetical protein